MALHKLSDRDPSTRGVGAMSVMGWEVRTRMDDEKVGKVDDVLVEDNGEARFLDVDLGLFSRRVLIPVERTNTDSTEDIVWVDGFNTDGFERIPEYDGDLEKLNADHRENLLQAYGTDTTSGAASPRTGAGPGGTRPAVAGAAGSTSTRRTDTHDRADRVEEAERVEAERDEEAERVEDTRAASPVGDTRLGRVDELDDYEVADHHPDVRGWDVRAADDRKIGGVKELVADTVAMKVRYLDVELESDFRRSDEESRVLVPIEDVRFNEDDEVVRLDALASHQMREIPAHQGSFDRDYEARLARIFRADASRNPTDAPRSPTNAPRNPNDPRR